MINIAFLYYDIMNLYGETGNIKVLEKSLDELKVEYNIDYLTLNEEIKFKKYDLVYIGCGTENNQEIVIKDLMKYKNDIKEYIESDKYFLVTGNALSIFGKNITRNNKVIDSLDIFDFHSIDDTRYANECIMKMDAIDEVLLGFQNEQTFITKSNYPLFDVLQGRGFILNNIKEGIHYKNFYGTTMIGPILSRNPYFLEYFLKQMILSIHPKFKFKKLNLNTEKEAYKTFINLYCKK